MAETTRTGETTSVYLQHELRAQLTARAGGDVIGGALQGAARRYYDLMWRSRPDLEAGQWRLICDALNGCWLEDVSERAFSARVLLESEVADAIRLNGLARKWEVDAARLLTTIRALEPAQAEAVLDVVRLFWARCHEPE